MSAGSLVEAALHVARLAGDVALSHFAAARRGELDAASKGDGTPVTLADRAAEAAARTYLAERFPGDGVLGEEEGQTGGDTPRRWVVDPIDGTKSFVRGVPLWGTLVAAVEGERVVAGAVVYPALGEWLAAGPGLGCQWSHGVARVSTQSSVKACTVLTSDERCPYTPERAASWRRLAEAASVARSWGDCFGYLLVATGRAEAMVDPILAPWDAAPFVPIVEEAGGVFTDWSGRATAFGGSAIATSALLAREVRALLGASQPLTHGTQP